MRSPSRALHTKSVRTPIHSASQSGIPTTVAGRRRFRAEQVSVRGVELVDVAHQLADSPQHLSMIGATAKVTAKTSSCGSRRL